MDTLASLIKADPDPAPIKTEPGCHLAGDLNISTVMTSTESVQNIKSETLFSAPENTPMTVPVTVPMPHCPGSAYECAGCNKLITDRMLLRALDQFWHEDCLKCSCCSCRLIQTGGSLYQRDNMLLCRNDYLRLFGVKGICSLCSQSIPASDLVMKVKGHVYHLDCFHCQQCSQKLSKGDQFTICDTRLLCSSCYTDMMNPVTFDPPVSVTSTATLTTSASTSGGFLCSPEQRHQVLQRLVRSAGTSSFHSNGSSGGSSTSTSNVGANINATNSRILDLLQSFSKHKKIT